MMEELPKTLPIFSQRYVPEVTKAQHESSVLHFLGIIATVSAFP